MRVCVRVRVCAVALFFAQKTFVAIVSVPFSCRCLSQPPAIDEYTIDAIVSAPFSCRCLSQPPASDEYTIDATSAKYVHQLWHVPLAASTPSSRPPPFYCCCHMTFCIALASTVALLFRVQCLFVCTRTRMSVGTECMVLLLLFALLFIAVSRAPAPRPHLPAAHMLLFCSFGRGFSYLNNLVPTLLSRADGSRCACSG